MSKHVDQENVFLCTDLISGKTKELTIAEGILTGEREESTSQGNLYYVGPGLIDLQVNGINGVDFNDLSLTVDDVVSATQYLLSQGVTQFLPTVITNSDENIMQLLAVIHQACVTEPFVAECVPGIHLEGPFISPANGAKGAHDENYIKAPDWELFQKFQEAAGGRIKLITLAPEWEGSSEFIKKCREAGVLVSIGHSIANTNHIATAVKAGATLSTHLGNGVPLMLPRHPNLIWDQLASEELYTCIIADGIHVPDSLIKVAMKVKGKQLLLVSDATCFAGMPPGEYQTHIGGQVVLTEEKRVSLKSTPQVLAGAAKSLLENVTTLVQHNLATLSESWQMASVNVADMLSKSGVISDAQNEDLVIFQYDGKKLHVVHVVKNGRVVFEQ